MSTLSQITLTQFRNYSFAKFSFPERITGITGPNGSGKTNLLDAIYYLCYTKSYFSAQQKHSIQTGTEGFRIEGVFTKNEANESIVCKWRNGKKEVSANGVEYERIADHIGRYAAVMIAPDDLVLINEGSEGRRRWIDSILSQTDRSYLEHLLQYQRVLQQRNAWLKIQQLHPSATRADLDYYNARLAESGTYLHQQRQAFIQEFTPFLDDFYHRLAQGNENISIGYESDLNTSLLAPLLSQSFEQDLRLQRTSRGIHKDDLLFFINDMPLKQYGSQGQKKSFLFALKLAQYEYLSSRQGTRPILLLDDVFEKLDQQRMEALLQLIQSPTFGQVILTDTHKGRIQEAFGTALRPGFIEL